MAEKEMLECIITELRKLDTRMDSLDTNVTSLNSRMDNLAQDVNNIKLTLENEIRPNIMRVAEGHLDLSRNLQAAMKPNNEVEMLSIKVGILETRVTDLEQKIS